MKQLIKLCLFLLIFTLKLRANESSVKISEPVISALVTELGNGRTGLTLNIKTVSSAVSGSTSNNTNFSSSSKPIVTSKVVEPIKAIESISKTRKGLCIAGATLVFYIAKKGYEYRKTGEITFFGRKLYEKIKENKDQTA